MAAIEKDFRVRNGLFVGGVASATSFSGAGTGLTGTATGLSIGGNASTATKTQATVTGTNTAELVRGNMADNDQFRILVGGTGSNAGFVEIATADDGTEPIHVRQYTGVFSTLVRTLTLLDGAGNTSFPGDITVNGGDIILGGTGRIQGIDTVTAATDATSKGYVDTAIANITMFLDGGSSNSIFSVNDPVIDGGAA